MELWIRSQDKECLMKVDRLDIDYTSGTHMIYEGGYQTLLAKYKTKERALEVLDEIQGYIEKQGTSELIANGQGIIEEAKYYGKVYNMPKE